MAVKSLLNQYRLSSVVNDPASRWVNYDDLRLHSFFLPDSWEVSLSFVPFHQTGCEGRWLSVNLCRVAMSALKNAKAGLSKRYTKGNYIIYELSFSLKMWWSISRSFFLNYPSKSLYCWLHTAAKTLQMKGALVTSASSWSLSARTFFVKCCLLVAPLLPDTFLA